MTTDTILNEVNHLAHGSTESFVASVETMFEIFGEVQANVAPALGGESIPIRTPDDLQRFKEKLLPKEPA